MKNNFLLTKKITAAAIVALASASLFAEHAPVYISPNNDGIQDVLEVPILVKEKRYVMEWSFFIYDKDKVPVRVISNKETMTYTYYQKNVKQKPEEKKKGWVCKVCGYVYEGEELPEDFVCPLCKHGASDFEKIE